jgi:hypothetical protein
MPKARRTTVKKQVFFIAVLFSSLSFSQCAPPSYSSLMVPFTPGDQVGMTTDDSGTGFNFNGYSLTPDPNNLPPQFTLGTETAPGRSAGGDFIDGAMTSWNGQPNGSAVSFHQGIFQNGANWIVSTAWPKATVTYPDSFGNPHTVTVDFSDKAPSVVAASQPLFDYAANGSNTGRSLGGVTLINTNGFYSVNGATFHTFAPNGANFDNALTQIGGHETGHGFGLGDRNGGNDIMSTWSTTTSNPAGAVNDQNGAAPFTTSSCDQTEIENNPNAPYGGGDGGGGNGGDCTVVPLTPNLALLQGPIGEVSCGGPKQGSPIIIDIEREGFHLTSAGAGVMFDISGTEHPVQIGWTDGNFHNAFLALPEPDGLVHNGKELFGNFTPQPPSEHPNGFIALAQYDDNGDGVIDARDAVYSKLRLWIDENHDGNCQPEELHRLPEFGVFSLSVKYGESRRTDQYGNQFRYKAIVNPGEHRDARDDGPGRWTYDVFFVRSESH